MCYACNILIIYKSVAFVISSLKFVKFHIELFIGSWFGLITVLTPIETSLVFC